MKRILIIAFVFFFTLPALFGQISSIINTCDSIDRSMFEPLLTGELLLTFPQTIGPQYYYDWDDADITMKSGEIVYDKKIRYNGYLNEMIWITPKDFKSVKLDKLYIKEVYFKNLHLLFKQMNFDNSKDSASLFAEVLFESKISMYAHRRIKQVQTEISSNKTNSISRDVIERIPVYYILLPGSSSYHELVYISKHALLNLFPGRKSEIRKLLRQNHLSIQTEKDFAYALKMIEQH